MLALVAAMAAPLVGGCGDPVWDDRVAALGDEAHGVRRGPLHRPGQPCLDCHRDGGTARAMGVAGTIYRTEGSLDPVEGALVMLVDYRLNTLALQTNAAGNFFVHSENFTLKRPFWVSVSLGEGDPPVQMESPMNLDGNCGACHQDPKGPRSAGHVYSVITP